MLKCWSHAHAVISPLLASLPSFSPSSSLFPVALSPSEHATKNNNSPNKRRNKLDFFTPCRFVIGRTPYNFLRICMRFQRCDQVITKGSLPLLEDYYRFL